MKLKQMDYSNLEKFSGDIGCARSGLKAQELHSILYTKNFNEQFKLYESILGSKNIRFKGDNIACFFVPNGEILLQGIEEKSPFLALVGKQSLALTVDNLDTIKKSKGIMKMARSSTKFRSEYLKWDIPVQIIEDPEGNLIHFIQAGESTEK